jgi:hypothetical protein
MKRIAATVAALVALAAPALAGETLAESLYAKAPAILQKLKKKDMTAVGVLKFTAVEDGKSADSLKELGLTLAVRTQTALVLANKDPQFVIIENPNAQVTEAGLFEANHQKEEGRKAFFSSEMKYLPAFGKDKVEASGFVVGTATPSADMKTIALKLQVFDKSGKLTDLTDEWTVETDAELLGLLGGSYALPPITRKAVVSGQPVKKEELQKLVVDTAVAVVKATPPTPDTKPVPNPALDNCPIKWQIRYNDKVQPVSGSLLPEPDEADKVSFVLTNPSKDETYAVVLMVNGESTLYKEKQAVAKCRKWILEPRTETVISGFQTGPLESKLFKVVRPEDPEVDSVRYSENLGQFRLVVFAGKLTDKNPNPVDGKAIDEVSAIANARLNARPTGALAQSLEELQASLTRTGRDSSNARGVVVAGAAAESKTVQAWFALASDTPVADITLRYFHPKK